VVSTEIALRLALGLVLSAAIGFIAHRRGSLSTSGAAGAILIGTVIFGFGGLVRGLLLIAFFVSSSVLSHHRHAQKEGIEEKFAKGGRRDLGQTLANGGVAALLAATIGWTGRDAAFYPVLAMAFYGALATATADTWATELGVLAKGRPRLITSGRWVPTGTSGGVTLQGTIAALAGATFVGAVGLVLTQAASIATSGGWLTGEWVIVPIAAVSGLAGAVIDSVLGATVQTIYLCDVCGSETERTVHKCGRATRRIRGWRWLNNDRVNFLASLAGAALAGAFAILIF